MKSAKYDLIPASVGCLVLLAIYGVIYLVALAIHYVAGELGIHIPWSPFITFLIIVLLKTIL